MRRHNERVGRVRQPLTRFKSGQHRRVVSAQQLVGTVCGEKHFVDDALHHRAAASVAEHDRCILRHVRVPFFLYICVAHIRRTRRRRETEPPAPRVGFYM